MASVLTFNPRRKRARRNKRRAARRTRRRHATHAAAPRRRRRLNARRRVARRNPRRRRIHRNPGFKLPGLSGELGRTVGQAAGIGAGMVVYDFATDWLAARLPANLQSGAANLAIKAGVGLIVLPMLAKSLPMTRGLAKPIALGAGALLVYELFQLYLAPHVAAATAVAAPATRGYGTRQISGYGSALPEANGQLAGMYQGMY